MKMISLILNSLILYNFFNSFLSLTKTLTLNQTLEQSELIEALQQQLYRSIFIRLLDPALYTFYVIKKN